MYENMSWVDAVSLRAIRDEQIELRKQNREPQLAIVPRSGDSEIGALLGMRVIASTVISDPLIAVLVSPCRLCSKSGYPKVCPYCRGTGVELVAVRKESKS